MLALACGYLFDALIIIPHALTFPGAFTPAGLLGAKEQTTAWLYTFWHGGRPEPTKQVCLGAGLMRVVTNVASLANPPCLRGAFPHGHSSVYVPWRECVGIDVRCRIVAAPVVAGTT